MKAYRSVCISCRSVLQDRAVIPVQRCFRRHVGKPFRPHPIIGGKNFLQVHHQPRLAIEGVIEVGTKAFITQKESPSTLRQFWLPGSVADEDAFAVFVEPERAVRKNHEEGAHDGLELIHREKSDRHELAGETLRRQPFVDVPVEIEV